MLSRKPICITAYIIVALCALMCSLQFFSEPGHRMWIHLGVKNPMGVTLINTVLLLAAITTLVCSAQWLSKKD
jgi:uncharacterized protein (DUF983 family)